MFMDPNRATVKDETALADFYRRALEETGYSASSVQSGKAALAVLIASAQALFQDAGTNCGT